MSSSFKGVSGITFNAACRVHNLSYGDDTVKHNSMARKLLYDQNPNDSHKT